MCRRFLPCHHQLDQLEEQQYLTVVRAIAQRINISIGLRMAIDANAALIVVARRTRAVSGAVGGSNYRITSMQRWRSALPDAESVFQILQLRFPAADGRHLRQPFKRLLTSVSDNDARILAALSVA